MGHKVIQLHFGQSTMNRCDIEVIVLAYLLYGLDVLLDEGVAQISTLFTCQYGYKPLLLVDDFGLLEDAGDDDFLALLRYRLDWLLSLFLWLLDFLCSLSFYFNL